ncbi:hypothetical protein L083_7246 [Actinoplanes sp. N902-109]|nr:hypothetical protein L083_7246 [Actinoplanes sp. N902-109]
MFIITAGLWPLPTTTVAEVMTEMRVPPRWDMFADNLSQGLANQFVGIVARRR